MMSKKLSEIQKVNRPEVHSLFVNENGEEVTYFHWSWFSPPELDSIQSFEPKVQGWSEDKSIEIYIRKLENNYKFILRVN